MGGGLQRRWCGGAGWSLFKGDRHGSGDEERARDLSEGSEREAPHHHWSRRESDTSSFLAAILSLALSLSLQVPVLLFTCPRRGRGRERGMGVAVGVGEAGVVSGLEFVFAHLSVCT